MPSFIKHFLMISFIITLGACTSITHKLQNEMEQGQYATVEELGKEWLEEQNFEGLDAQELEKSLKERAKVRRFVARARLILAKQKPGIKALQQFQSLYRQQDPMFRDLIKNAWREEAKRVYQQVKSKQSVAAHSNFRMRYPQSPHEKDSRQRQIDIAWTEVTKVNKLKPYQEFANKYKDWSELQQFKSRLTQKTASAWYHEITINPATESIAAHESFRARFPNANETNQSKQRQVLLDFEASKNSSSEAKMIKFQKKYETWPQAQSVMKEAYKLSASYGIREAKEANDLDALPRLRRSYPETEWIDQIDTVEVQIASREIYRSLQDGQEPNTHQMQKFIKTYLHHPKLNVLSSTFTPLINPIINHKKSIWLSRLARVINPSRPDFDELYKWESEQVQQLIKLNPKSTSILNDYLTWYSTTEQAKNVDQSLEHLRKLEKINKAWPKVKVQQKIQSKNKLDLVLNIKDCTALGPQYVSGVEKEQLNLIDDQQTFSPSKFRGVEDARDLDIMFNLDLSGSMDTERTAVDYAVFNFVERLAFRRRNARIGLTAFGDILYSKHRPSKSIKNFRKWMSELPRSFGGQGEDAMQAMWKSSQLMRNNRAEKVSITITDEPLQINQEGLRSLKVKLPSECKKVRYAHTCITKCGASGRPDCILKCIPMLPKHHIRSYYQCMKEHKRRIRGKKLKIYCANSIKWYQIVSKMNTCTRNVDNESKEFKALAKILKKNSIRPVFFIPNEYNMASFTALADELQGQVNYVPQNATEPKPYIDALEELSEQLSTQYEVTYPLKAKVNNTNPVIEVSEKTSWHAKRALPETSRAIFAKGSEACPDLISISDTGSTQYSPSEPSNNGSCVVEDWKNIGELGAPLQQSFILNNEQWITNKQGKLFKIEFDASEKSLKPETTLKVFNLNLVEDKLFALASDTDDASTPQEYDLYQLTDSKWDKLPPLPKLNEDTNHKGLMISLVDPSTSTICIQRTAQFIDCLFHKRWKQFPSKGLTNEMINDQTVVHSLSYRPEVSLLAGANGKIYRTYNGGRSWSEVSQFASPEGTMRIMSSKGYQPRVCATNSDQVLCSSDSGLQWTDKTVSDKKADPNAKLSLALVGTQYWLGYKGKARRLERVVNRDIPSSSVYFKTDQDVVRPKLIPFLNEIAQRLDKEHELSLRIEGHADYRGKHEYNQDLAKRRAQNVAQVLYNQGIAPSRIEAISYGEDRPLIKGTSARALSVNRRVELILTQAINSNAEKRAWSMCNINSN